MELTQQDKIDSMSVEILIKSGCDVQYKDMTVCDLKKHYEFQAFNGPRYQVHNDTSDLKVNEVFFTPKEAAECFIENKRKIQ